MPRCKRCGQEFTRYGVSDRYCPPCEREVAALTAPRRAPAFTPAWRREAKAKDMTGVVV